ncbi:MAG: toxin-antitoxin system HicB family antitoxin [Clostridia bacterium]|nr:toxin-antitoxin system HicB family antitoxin [Clostridia bacterium]
MKTIDEYMALPYRFEIIPDMDEGGFVGAYPELPGCLTSGETIEEVARNAEDAKHAWLVAAMEDGVVIHEPETLDAYSGQFKLRIPKSLHRSLAEHARNEGTSMNQYCLYLLTKNDATYGMQS